MLLRTALPQWAMRDEVAAAFDGRVMLSSRFQGRA